MFILVIRLLRLFGGFDQFFCIFQRCLRSLPPISLATLLFVVSLETFVLLFPFHIFFD